MLLLLVLYAFTLPLLVAAFVNMLWLAILIDIIAVQSFFALNEVARDLEDPFVYEPNDLPMARLQVIHLDINEHLTSHNCDLVRFISAVWHIIPVRFHILVPTDKKEYILYLRQSMV